MILAHSTQIPKVTITRVKRAAIIDEIGDCITLWEQQTKIELTLPSIINGLKDKFYTFLGSLLLPKIYAC